MCVCVCVVFQNWAAGKLFLDILRDSQCASTSLSQNISGREEGRRPPSYTGQFNERVIISDESQTIFVWVYNVYLT